MGAYGIAYERHRIDRITRDITVRGLPRALDGLRVGMITDVHHSAVVSADDVQQAVTLLKDAAPDIVVLGGDYVSFFDRTFVAPVSELLAPLADAPQGSFAVLGNHDDEKDVPTALTSKGFTVLRDQRTQLTIKGERLDIAGIRFWTRGPADVAAALKGTSGNTILIAHDPRRLVEGVCAGAGSDDGQAEVGDGAGGVDRVWRRAAFDGGRAAVPVAGGGHRRNQRV